MTDPSGVITASAGDAEDANTKTPFSAQETVLKAHQSEAEGKRGEAGRGRGIGVARGEREGRERRRQQEQAPSLTSLSLATSRLPLNQCRIRQVRQGSGPDPRVHVGVAPTQLRLIAKAAETVGQITRLPK